MTAVADQAGEQTDRTVELAVGGMTCAACANRVQRKLNKLDGVSASVNYATEKAAVHAAAGVGVAELIGQVEQAGYQASVVEPEAPAAPDGGQVGYLWRRLVVALLLGVPMGDLSITLALVPSLRFPAWQWVLLAMALPVASWCAWPFHRKAVLAARHHTSSMDTLISLGVVAATVWSLYTIFFVGAPGESTAGVWGLIFAPGGSIYLDVAAGVTVFVLAGRLFEARAKRQAGGALRALAAVGAKDVAVLGPDGSERRVPVSGLAAGDTFVTRPGETIATDGEVVSGASAVDTSAMTGESVPAEIGQGEPVIGGTIATSGRLVVRATRVGAETQLAQLKALVENAQNDKAAVQRLADRISAVFVPVVLVFSALTLTGWLAAGSGAAHAFSAALAVLIIACPCALGLATPTALLVASGRGAQLGVFIKGHQALENARRIDTVVLDKTGTLTTGKMSVADVWLAEGVGSARLLRAAGGIEAASEHVIGAAIRDFARLEHPELPEVTGFEALAGLGARGRVDGHGVLVGSARLLAETGVDEPPELGHARAEWEAAGRTAVLVAADGALLGAFAVADTVKPSAAGAVAALHRQGLSTVLLSGDNRATAAAVAEGVGIDEVIAEVLPADKAGTVAALRDRGRSVAMVGDGVNDAPALATADLGLAVVTGTDVALGAADLILVRDNLDAVPTAMRLARATLGTIRGNLAWAFGYNVAALPLAALGLLNPLIAGGAMAASSLLVVSNSLRLSSVPAARE
jgi:cation-transporting P-type ATPase A/B/Cu+-exporting ATPase